MFGRLVVVLVVAGCGRIGFEAPARDGAMDIDGAPFDAGAWTEHVMIDVGNPTTEELRDVPILVRLDPSRIDYSIAATGGADLRFTDNGTELAHEVEHWRPGGTSIVWVRVPRLAASPARTTLAMHYGNPMAPAVDGDATWSADHVGVYHFAGGVNDATSTHLDAQLVGGGFLATNLLGEALELSTGGSDEYAMISNIGALDDVVTFSLWMRSNSASPALAFEGGLVWPQENTVEDSPYLGFNEDNVFFETVNADGANEGRTLGPVPVGQWVHLALVWRATTVETYVDGQPTVTIVIPDGPLRPAMPLLFGADCTNCSADATPTNDFLDGSLDEVRLERVPRSAAWFAVQYASMRDTLIAW